MKTKSCIYLLAMAVLGLASCNKEPLIEKPKDPVSENDGDYVIEIEGLEATKGSASTVELNLANLSYSSSKTISAQLKRKSGSNWVNVNDGVVYTWSASSADNQKFSGSGTVNKSCKVSAIAKGSGTLTVSASISGSNVASQGVPVVVSDSRSLSWSSATTPIQAGEVKSAVLNSNFSGSVTVSSDNNSFVVGTSASSLSSSVSITFGSNTSQTIYYKYTGSQQTTVTIKSFSSDNSVSATFPISATSIPKISLTFDYLYYEYWNEDQDGREYSEGSDETLYVCKITKADGTSVSFTKNPPAFSVILNGTTLSNNQSYWVEEAPLEGCDDMLFYIINPGLVFKITYGGYEYQFSAKDVEFVTHSPTQENQDRIQYINNNL